jgi:hypothetical protein
MVGRLRSRWMVLLLAASCAATAEQTVSVAGKVVDPEGAAIARASVVLAEQSNPDMRYEATTNSSGDFSLASVVPGIYTLTIEAQAWTDKTISNVRITSGESRDLKNIALQFAGCFSPGVMCDNFGTGAPLLHAEASVDVPFNCGVDADGGGVRCKTSDSSVDFRVQTGTNGEIYLSPAKGARLALDTHGEWTKSDCVNSAYAASQLRVDQLKHNYRVCVHTNNGRYAEVYGFYKSPVNGTVHMTFETW